MHILRTLINLILYPIFWQIRQAQIKISYFSHRRVLVQSMSVDPIICIILIDHEPDTGGNVLSIDFDCHA